METFYFTRQISTSRWIPKSLQFILWRPWMSVQNCTKKKIVEIFYSPDWQRSNSPVISRAVSSARLKPLIKHWTLEKNHLQFMQSSSQSLAAWGIYLLIACKSYQRTQGAASYWILWEFLFWALPSWKKSFAALSHHLTNELTEHHRDLTKLGSRQEMMRVCDCCEVKRSDTVQDSR